MNIRINRFVPKTAVLGRGIRSALWVQGCKRRCKGCIAEEMRDIHGGRLTDTAELALYAVSESSTEGITISGGEPFLQPEALCDLLQRVRAQRPDYGVVIYTGFTYDELRSMNNASVNAVLDDFTDTLIDGEYREELNDNRGLRGSSNQHIIHLTERYADYEGYLTAQPRKSEFYLDRDGAYMVGVPSVSTAALAKGFEKKRDLL